MVSWVWILEPKARRMPAKKPVRRVRTSFSSTGCDCVGEPACMSTTYRSYTVNFSSGSFPQPFVTSIILVPFLRSQSHLNRT